MRHRRPAARPSHPGPDCPCRLRRYRSRLLLALDFAHAAFLDVGSGAPPTMTGRCVHAGRMGVNAMHALARLQQVGAGQWRGDARAAMLEPSLGTTLEHELRPGRRKQVTPRGNNFKAEQAEPVARALLAHEPGGVRWKRAPREVMPHAPRAPGAERADHDVALAHQHPVDLPQQFMWSRRVFERMRQQHGLDRIGRDRQRIVVGAYGAGAFGVGRNPAPVLRARACAEVAGVTPATDLQQSRNRTRRRVRPAAAASRARAPSRPRGDSQPAICDVVLGHAGKDSRKSPPDVEKTCDILWNFSA